MRGNCLNFVGLETTGHHRLFLSLITNHYTCFRIHCHRTLKWRNFQLGKFGWSLKGKDVSYKFVFWLNIYLCAWPRRYYHDCWFYGKASSIPDLQTWQFRGSLYYYISCCHFCFLGRDFLGSISSQKDLMQSFRFILLSLLITYSVQLYDHKT